MSAAASPQFEQLPMFMSAREITATHVPWEADKENTRTNMYPEGRTFNELEDEHGTAAAHALTLRHPYSWETDEQLMARKYRAASSVDALGGSLRDSLLREGVHNPVSLDVDPFTHLPTISGGNHRVAVMLRHKPDALMPVEHNRIGAPARGEGR
jgi:hypothetical protein